MQTWLTHFQCAHLIKTRIFGYKIKDGKECYFLEACTLLQHLLAEFDSSIAFVCHGANHTKRYLVPHHNGAPISAGHIFSRLLG